MDSRSCHCKCIFNLQEIGVKAQPPALAIASILNHAECVKTLVEAGADVNDIPDYTFVCHRTALSLAAQMGHSDSVRALIAAGADVNQMDARLCTALCYAAQGGQSECIKLLIESGADVNRDVCVEMPHLMKSQHNHEYKRSALMWLYYPESSVQRTFEQSYYHLTEERYKAFSRNPNREQCLEILLEAGADVNIVDTRGHTLLTHLAKQPDMSYHVKKLLVAGADVNLVGPIFSALSMNADKNLDLLLM